MALLQAQHPSEAEPRLGVSRIDAQRSPEERFGATKLRACGADGDRDAHGWSRRPDELLHLRRCERFVQTSPEHRQHRIVRKQAERLVEMLGVQVHLAQQRGARWRYHARTPLSADAVGRTRPRSTLANFHWLAARSTPT